MKLSDFDAVMIAEGAQEADQETTLQAWQHLIDNGMAWSLQGWFGRTAVQLIDAGHCTPPRDRLYPGIRAPKL